MNERIEKLIEQAGIESYPAKLLVNTDKEGKVSSKWEIPLEKFAELIVRECADICMEMAAKCAGLPGDGALAKDCADWILKDFGVEE
jgi:hypothetical protein